MNSNFALKNYVYVNLISHMLHKPYLKRLCLLAQRSNKSKLCLPLFYVRGTKGLGEPARTNVCAGLSEHSLMGCAISTNS